MKVTVAMDSFKGSLTSMEAGNAVKAGILQVYPDACVNVFPLSDGGEGIGKTLAYAEKNILKNNKVQSRTIKVTGPLGEAVTASYLMLGEKSAVIEMAEASGLCLVPEERRNPLIATTYGVGEMIADAIKTGCRHFVIGIGGSATNDGGVGMLQALGFDFLDENGRQISRGAKDLGKIAVISDDHILSKLSECTFQVACDVENPLVGEMGCSRVFAPQKGASPQDVSFMEKGMVHYANLAEEWYRSANGEKDAPDRFVKGTGAAGGMGFAFLLFLNGNLVRGIDLVLQKLGIENEILDSNYVITGEGKLDGQTAMGKGPAGLAKIAKRHGKKVIAFAGSVGEKSEDFVLKEIFDECFSVEDKKRSLKENMQKETAMTNLISAVRQYFEGKTGKNI